METHTPLPADEVTARVAAAVRQALAEAGETPLDRIVETAREAMIGADMISLFALESEHPEHGAVHWLIGQANGEEAGFVVLALTRGEAAHDLHAAGSADLSDALMQLAPRLATPLQPAA